MGLSIIFHVAGWVQLSAMALIVWVFGPQFWPLLLIPLPFFALAIIVALKERVQASITRARSALDEEPESGR